MQELLDRFNPNPKYQRPQSALQNQLERTWNLYGTDLLHTYDIPGLPPDNLQIEGLFGRLRRHQRRISGRKSTRPLREFGHYQVLFSADSQAIYYTISARFPSKNIANIGNSLKTLKPLAVLCTACIEMHQVPCGV